MAYRDLQNLSPSQRAGKCYGIFREHRPNSKGSKKAADAETLNAGGDFTEARITELGRQFLAELTSEWNRKNPENSAKCGGPGSGQPGPCASKVKFSKPAAEPDQKPVFNHDTFRSRAGAIAKSLSFRAWKYPRSAVRLATEMAQRKYAKYSAEYGPRWAQAIVAAALVGAMPAPGTLAVPIVVIGAAKLYRSFGKGGGSQKGGHHPGWHPDFLQPPYDGTPHDEPGGIDSEKAGESFFGKCNRDDKGHCVSEGGSSKPSVNKPAHAPASPPVKPPANQAQTLLKIQRSTRERDLNDAMRELSGTNLYEHLQNTPEAILKQFDAHGTATLGTLTQLLNGGIDPKRNFYSENLASKEGGRLLRDDSPFVVISHPGKSLKDEGIPAVFVDPLHEPNIPDLQQAFPGVKFFPATRAGEILTKVSQFASEKKSGGIDSQKLAGPAPAPHGGGAVHGALGRGVQQDFEKDVNKAPDAPDRPRPNARAVEQRAPDARKGWRRFITRKSAGAGAPVQSAGSQSAGGALIAFPATKHKACKCGGKCAACGKQGKETLTRKKSVSACGCIACSCKSCCADASCYTYKVSDTVEGLVHLDDKDIETNDQEMSAACILCSGIRDRQGDIIEPAGVDFTEHRWNPIAFWDHGKQYNLPIGLTESPDGEYTVAYHPEENIITQRTYFAPTRFARQIYALIRLKYIRANSIATKDLIVKALPPDPDAGHYKAGKHIIKSNLAEVTWTALPANPDAVASLCASGRLDTGGFDSEQLEPLLLKSFLPYLPPRKVWSAGLTLKRFHREQRA